MKRMAVFIFTTVAGAIACGGTTVSSDDFPQKDASGDVTKFVEDDSGIDTSKPYACGNTTCGAGLYCVHPCCGGILPPCMDLPDSGTCPPGTHLSNQCFNGPNPGCQVDPCKPPPPFCATRKEAEMCGVRAGRDVTCLCG